MKIAKIIILAAVVCVVLALGSCGKNKNSRCDHEWTEATCVSKAVCKICGSETGELNGSNHAGTIYWEKTANTHYKAYSCCGEKVSSAENHTKMNGICTVCGFDPIIGASSVKISADGNTATVVITITDNPGILGLEMSVSFDDSTLVLVSATSGSAMNGLAFTASEDFSQGGKFLWDGVDAIAVDGEVLVLTFDISDAPAGNYSIMLKVHAYDNELNTLSFKIGNINITVE